MARNKQTVVVVGLGYVGLPLAVALCRTTECWGFDIDGKRIAELKEGWDRTGEIDSEKLTSCGLELTDDPAACPPADVYIVTVPTPVDDNNQPDLSIVMASTRTVAAMIDPARQPVVVFESTVYPGVTEDLCGPEIERLSGLKAGHDFFLGYSPERINPGDREHTIDRITKVVSGQDPATLDRVAALYEGVTSGGVYRAASIKTAEAAKVIENAQRDINIAFVNEITQIFGSIDLSVWDVLDAARTKWNFLPFQPGLVGGHCIGVDPYYLSHLATTLGKNPQVILAGRNTNDGMARWIATQALGELKPASVLVLGLTFKEDVPDLRNSKVADLVAILAASTKVTVHDPLADAAEAAHEYGITLDPDALEQRHYDLVLLAVPHADYTDQVDALGDLVGPEGRFFDLKRAAPELQKRLGHRYVTI